MCEEKKIRGERSLISPMLQPYLRNSLVGVRRL